MKLSQILPLVVGGAVAGMVLSGASPAQALSYTFSFSNVEGTVPGTVSGTIVLPDGDGTSAATSVLITSAPGGLGYDPTGFDFVSNTVENLFVVSGGNIDAANSAFIGFFNGGTALSLKNTLADGSTFLDALNGSNLGATGVRDASSATLTYGAASTPVPFDTPAGQAMATVGSLFALGLMRQAKKRLAVKKLVVNPMETVVS
ncbi:hypothetical protein WJM97_01830 [Okeanomitos corallinicola TIOX110]|uniref:PEP-CTERM sorting domain-containing protein n=1 Tax=Okeanomitos corallinicola TIOX110 TaxID=3133117 RepID=A0ABZ2USS8_9CYAN